MKILTLDDRAYSIEKIPEWVDEKLRFAVLDNSDPGNPDFFYIPLIFLESFNAPAAVLQIGEQGQPEMHVLPITSLNDRGFDAFTFNPLSSVKPDFYPIDVVDIYTEVKWYFPKIKSGQMLAVPLSGGPKPICAYFVKEISRQCEQVDYGDVW
jgi:hypothetical protein